MPQVGHSSPDTPLIESMRRDAAGKQPTKLTLHVAGVRRCAVVKGLGQKRFEVGPDDAVQGLKSGFGQVAAEGVGG